MIADIGCICCDFFKKNSPRSFPLGLFSIIITYKPFLKLLDGK